MVNTMLNPTFINRLGSTDRYLQSLDLSQRPPGLAEGNMGVCLYFYYLSEWTGDDSYRRSADRLLELLFASAGKVSTIGFCDGLAGIAWCLLHFLQKGWVNGEPDEVLREVDNVLYRTLHFEWLADEKRTRADLLGLLFYLSFRLPTVQDPQERLLMEESAIALVNRLEDSFAEHPWRMWRGFHLYRTESMVYLYILSKLYEAGCYRPKIRKIWERMSYPLLSIVPALPANRLLWAFGMEQVLDCEELPGWRDHVQLLRERTDAAKTVREDFRNKDVSLARGVSGLALLLLLGKDKTSTQAVFPEIVRKIEASDIWNGRFCPDGPNFLTNMDLFGGYTGTALICHGLQRYVSKEDGL